MGREGEGGSSSVSESNFPRGIDRSFDRLIIRGFLNIRRPQPVRGKERLFKPANVFFPRIKSIMYRQSDVSSFE